MIAFSVLGAMGADPSARKVPRWSAPASFQSRPLFFVVYVTLILCAFSLKSVSAQCVTNFDADVDYFPDKITSTNVLDFTISYHKNFKIITNTHVSQSYVAVLCGTPEPDSSEYPAGSVVVQIPPATVGVDSQTTMPLLQHLGDLDKMKFIGGEFGPPKYPDCVDSSGVKTQSPDGLWQDQANPVDIFFTENDFKVNEANWPTDKVNVIYSVTESKDLEDQLKWVQYIGAFMNEDGKANQVVSAYNFRSGCLKALGSRLNSPNLITNNNVLFITSWFVDTFSGSGLTSVYVGECQNYYCEAIDSAGGNIIELADLTGFNQGGSPAQLINAIQANNINQIDYIVITGTADKSFFNVPAENAQLQTDIQTMIDAIETINANSLVKVYDLKSNDDWFYMQKATSELLILDLLAIIHPTVNLDSFTNNPALFNQYYPENENDVHNTLLLDQSCSDPAEDFVITIGLPQGASQACALVGSDATMGKPTVSMVIALASVFIMLFV